MPGVVVGRRLQELGHRVLFIGEGKKIEENLCADHQVEMLRPASGGGRLSRWFQLSTALRFEIVRNGPPDLCLAFGGFTSLAMGCKSILKGYPLWLFEQNAIPGRVNRFLGRWASGIGLSYAQAQSYFKVDLGIIHHTGNPVREVKAQQEKIWDILVCGGSQGALAINRHLPQHLPRSAKILHVAGPGRSEECREIYKKLGHQRVEVIDTHPHLPEAMGQSKWVIMRAGATSLAEAAVVGSAVILIPYPHAKDDHQRANAKWLQDLNACMVMEEELLRSQVNNPIEEWLADEDLSQRLSASLRKSAIADVSGQRVIEALGL